jgi:hypothetical protein
LKSGCANRENNRKFLKNRSFFRDALALTQQNQYEWAIIAVAGVKLIPLIGR